MKINELVAALIGGQHHEELARNDLQRVVKNAPSDETLEKFRVLAADLTSEDLLVACAAFFDVAAALRERNEALVRIIKAQEPLATTAVAVLEGATRAAPARREALSLRVDMAYGSYACSVAREMDGQSRMAIAREIRRRVEAGAAPKVRLPADDRAITETLKKRGF